MANINDLFPSKYLKASDLHGQARRVTISNVAVEEIAQGEHKPVIYFSNAPKPVVLNKTNGQLLASFLGLETAAWSGNEIEIYPEKVGFQGKIVDAIRMRQVVPPAAPTPAPAAAQAVPESTAGATPAAAPAGEPFNDDLPVTWDS